MKNKRLREVKWPSQGQKPNWQLTKAQNEADLTSTSLHFSMPCNVSNNPEVSQRSKKSWILLFRKEEKKTDRDHILYLAFNLSKLIRFWTIGRMSQWISTYITIRLLHRLNECLCLHPTKKYIKILTPNVMVLEVRPLGADYVMRAKHSYMGLVTS